MQAIHRDPEQDRSPVALRSNLSLPADPNILHESLSGAFSSSGLGLQRALNLVESTVLANCIWQGHTRSLAFVPNSPTSEAMIMDEILARSTFMGTSWLEASGATAAENQALRWLSDMIGFSEEAGGTFVSGGTIANLTALSVAAFKARLHSTSPPRTIVVSGEVHSSVHMAARVLGLHVITLPADDDFRFLGAALDELHADVIDDICAVVGSAGSTNTGAVDDLRGIGRWCCERDIWFHVDAAYGGAALAVESMRSRFAGIELADSVVIDPHKWLFATLDCSAIIYREPENARALFGQQAAYIDTAVGQGAWDPSDYAPHFTRRCRGLPFWFSVVANGTQSVARDVQRGIDLAQGTATLVKGSSNLELVTEPTLSIVVFKRVGWVREDYCRWANKLLATGIAFVAPTSIRGEPAARLCFVNPATSIADVQLILESMD